jgi:carboxylesterase type B
MVGGVTDEASGLAYNATSRREVTEFIKSLYPGLDSADLESINDAYPQLPPVPMHAEYFPTASAIITDMTFTCPGLQMTRRVSNKHRPDAWNYRYNVQDPTFLSIGLGVPHTVETVAIFGLDYGGPIIFPSMLDTNAGIIPIVMHYFISFVRDLNPNTLKHITAPEWQPWGDAQERLKIETHDTVMEGVPEDQQGRCALFEDLAPKSKQ